MTGTHCWLVRIILMRTSIVHHNPQPLLHTLLFFAMPSKAAKNWGHAPSRLGYAPLVDGDNDDYNDGEEFDGEGETPEERVTILFCIFRDFYPPPTLIGCALTVLCWGEGRAHGGCHGRVQRQQ
jgi:hypothetical protein